MLYRKIKTFLDVNEDANVVLCEESKVVPLHYIELIYPTGLQTLVNFS